MPKDCLGRSYCPYFTERETEAREPEPLVQEGSDAIAEQGQGPALSIQPPLAQDWSRCDIPGVPVPPTLRCACIQDSPRHSTSGEPHSRLLGTWQRPGAGSPASSRTIAGSRRGATAARRTRSFQLQVPLVVEEVPPQPQVGWLGLCSPTRSAPQICHVFSSCTLTTTLPPHTMIPFVQGRKLKFGVGGLALGQWSQTHESTEPNINSTTIGIPFESQNFF